MDSVVITQKGNETVFSGGTFRDLIRAYSYRRMAIDPKYRREVRAAKAAKKATRLAEQEARVEKPS